MRDMVKEVASHLTARRPLLTQARTIASFLTEYFSDDRDFVDIHFIPDEGTVKMLQRNEHNTNLVNLVIPDLDVEDIRDFAERIVAEVRATAKVWNPRPWWDTPARPARPAQAAGKWRKFNRRTA